MAPSTLVPPSAARGHSVVPDLSAATAARTASLSMRSNPRWDCRIAAHNPISRWDCRNAALNPSSRGKPKPRAYAAEVIEKVECPVESVMDIVGVELGDRAFPIYIGSGLLNRPPLLQRHVKGKNVLIVTNTTVAPLYLDKVLKLLRAAGSKLNVETVILPDGENHKDIGTLMKIIDKAGESRMDRSCTFVALGGGVIGDMCGLAAARFLRGVNLIQIPTTLTAQVESSVGGKTGVNHPLGKNLIWAFHQPQCVLVDTDTLNTLPDIELSSGIAKIAEVVKCDPEFFKWLEHNMNKLLARDPSALAYAVKRSCENKAQAVKRSCKNKAQVVSLDEREEAGLRATLNLEPGIESGIDVVDVELGDRAYPIYIGSGLLNRPELLQRHVKGKDVLIVTNTTVAPLYLDKVVDLLRAGGSRLNVETVILPDGEKHKEMGTMMKVIDKAGESGMDDPSCTFVALGGGVIGDTCGVAAATFLGGVNFIQIPTTLMAQVDSSVGGKTGVNHPLGKNLIGAFYQPQCVLADTDTLNTLPDRELSSGIAEVVKYGLIRDPEFFKWLEQNMEKLLARDPGALAYAVKRSCENKAQVVSLDEREETGLRATLNLGHTFGHAIETGIGYGEWLHGEAVSAGTVMAADLSHRLGWIDEKLKSRLTKLLQRAGAPISLPSSMTIEKFKDIMAVDKKVVNGDLRLILLKGELGNCVLTAEYRPEALEQTLRAFCA